MLIKWIKQKMKVWEREESLYVFIRTQIDATLCLVKIKSYFSFYGQKKGKMDYYVHITWSESKTNGNECKTKTNALKKGLISCERFNLSYFFFMSYSLAGAQFDTFSANLIALSSLLLGFCVFLFLHLLLKWLFGQRFLFYSSFEKHLHFSIPPRSISKIKFWQTE